MKTKAFARKQNRHHARVASHLSRPRTDASGLRHQADPVLHLQRTIGNRAVQRMLQTHAEQRRAGSTGTIAPRAGHDFSGISLHPHATSQSPSARGSAVVSSPDDAHEREADAVANRVMRMAAPAPERSAAAAPAFHHTQQEGRAGSPQREAAAAAGAEAAPAAGPALSAARNGGVPLPPRARAFFEPRFGQDLGHVRLHVGDDAARGARAVQARAYTVGSDIVFGAGQYAPSTMEGGHLLAHELAHVVRQDSSPALINRKIRCDPNVSLSGYFSAKGISNVTQSRGLYSRARGGALNFEQEILIDMLASPRIFNVAGGMDALAAASLNAHVKARIGIVSFAAQKKYTFASLSGWSMNPKYYDWNVSKASWKMKPGVNKQEAWDDLNANPQLYAIGCAAATDLTMKGGSKGADIIDKPSSDTADWVPGDAGYVENASYQPGIDIGLMGENIIYTGTSQFWGHFSGGVTYRTLAEWIKLVEKWTAGGGTAKVEDKRELPATGLLDK
jgi:hypothetical protein